MRVLLVQPSQKIVIGKKKKNGSIMPSLGLMSIASSVRKNCDGVTIEIFDYEVKNGNPEPDFRNFDVIGISATSVHIPHASIIIDAVRAVNKTAIIVIGGAHATFAYNSLLRDLPELDAVIIGEGELSFPLLINNCTSRLEIPESPGIVSRLTANIEMSPIVRDLDSLPWCAYDLIDISKYQLATHRSILAMPFISVMTSRGCPFSCEYCQTPTMFGSFIRYRSAKSVYDECLYLKKELSYNSIVFWDDTFTSNRAYVLELCSYLSELDVNWMCNTRVDCVDMEILTIMKEAGCRNIFFGVESFDEPTLKLLNRTTNEAAVKDAFSNCKKIGIHTVAALMIGTPYDTIESIEYNIVRLKSLQPDNVYISIYNATVGSKEFSRCIMSGDIDANINWTNPNNFIGPPFGLPTVSSGLNRFQLQKAQKSIYTDFYEKGHGEQYE